MLELTFYMQSRSSIVVPLNLDLSMEVTIWKIFDTYFAAYNMYGIPSLF